MDSWTWMSTQQVEFDFGILDGGSCMLWHGSLLLSLYCLAVRVGSGLADFIFVSNVTIILIGAKYVKINMFMATYVCSNIILQSMLVSSSSHINRNALFSLQYDKLLSGISHSILRLALYFNRHFTDESAYIDNIYWRKPMKCFATHPLVEILAFYFINVFMPTTLAFLVFHLYFNRQFTDSNIIKIHIRNNFFEHETIIFKCVARETIASKLSISSTTDSRGVSSWVKYISNQDSPQARVD
ncbi:hypothetical protein ACJX0J_007835, partial [Zea mays]